MLERFKKARYMRQRNRIVANAMCSDDLKPFDDEFYERYKGKILGGLPVAVRIKYYRPEKGNDGRCKFRAELLTYGFPESAKMFQARLKTYEYEFGPEKSTHCWVEYGGWCFDPTALIMARKNVYYAIQQPYPDSIVEIGQKRFDNPEYQDTYAGNIQKFMPGGEKRSELNAAVAVLTEPTSGSMGEFQHEMRKFLRAVKL